MATRKVSGSLQSRGRRRGVSIVLVGIVLVALVAFVSLAIDIGRLRLAKAQLQTAADSAARAGAYSLYTRADTPQTSQDVINQAVAAALSNPALNTATQGNRQDTGVALNTTQDVIFGNWNKTTRVFTPITDKANSSQDERRGANAVQVWGRRFKSRGNPLKLIFAPVLGVFSSDVEVKATAYITGGNGTNFGFIGLQRVESNGNKAKINGGVASDGDIDLINGDVRNIAASGNYPGVTGDARPGINGSLLQHNNSQVDGWTANLDYQLAPYYPVIQSPPADAQTFVTSTNITLVGGSSVANRINYTGAFPKTSGNAMDAVTLNISGYVRIYLTSDLDLSKVTVKWTNPSTPSADRLEYFLTGNQCKTVWGNGNQQTFCHVYAPQCDVEIGGTRDFTGWAIGKTLTFTGNSTYTYDGTQRSSNTNPYVIHLVE